MREKFYTADGLQYEFSYVDLVSILLDMIDGDTAMSGTVKKNVTDLVRDVGYALERYSA